MNKKKIIENNLKIIFAERPIQANKKKTYIKNQICNCNREDDKNSKI